MIKHVHKGVFFFFHWRYSFLSVFFQNINFEKWFVVKMKCNYSCTILETLNQEVDLPQLTSHICSIQPFFLLLWQSSENWSGSFSWLDGKMKFLWYSCPSINGNHKGVFYVIANMILLLHLSQRSWIINWHK